MKLVSENHRNFNVNHHLITRFLIFLLIFKLNLSITLEIIK